MTRRGGLWPPLLCFSDASYTDSSGSAPHSTCASTQGADGGHAKSGAKRMQGIEDGQASERVGGWRRTRIELSCRAHTRRPSLQAGLKSRASASRVCRRNSGVLGRMTRAWQGIGRRGSKHRRVMSLLRWDMLRWDSHCVSAGAYPSQRMGSITLQVDGAVAPIGVSSCKQPLPRLDATRSSTVHSARRLRACSRSVRSLGPMRAPVCERMGGRRVLEEHVPRRELPNSTPQRANFRATRQNSTLQGLLAGSVGLVRVGRNFARAEAAAPRWPVPFSPPTSCPPGRAGGWRTDPVPVMLVVVTREFLPLQDGPAGFLLG